MYFTGRVRWSLTLKYRLVSRKEDDLSKYGKYNNWVNSLNNNLVLEIIFKFPFNYFKLWEIQSSWSYKRIQTVSM
jgi:hypothetical protein